MSAAVRVDADADRLRGGNDASGEEFTEVVIFGDSQAHGTPHNDAGRYSTPWPRLLEERAESEFGLRVISCSLPSRTTRWDDAGFGNQDWAPRMKPSWFNGRSVLLPTLLQHSPNVLVVALGTNDLHRDVQRYHVEERIAHGGSARALTPEEMATAVATSCVTLALEAAGVFPHLEENNVVLLTPPRLYVTAESASWGFNKTSEAIAAVLPAAFSAVCRANGLICAHPAAVDMRESADGVHYTEAHGVAVADAVFAAIAKAKKGRKRARAALFPGMMRY
tara:strand:- start:39 stop:875 length:837 start_codon:yes stop_codon:yes gene_type:complete